MGGDEMSTQVVKKISMNNRVSFSRYGDQTCK